MALSTTHVATGSIMGSGLTGPKGEVRWGVAGRMALAWITTLPIAAAISFVTWWVAKWASTIGGDLVWGGILLTVILAIGGGYMFYRAQLQPVHRDNVNDDWDPIDGPEGPQTGPTGPAHIVDTTHGLNHHLGK